MSDMEPAISARAPLSAENRSNDIAKVVRCDRRWITEQSSEQTQRSKPVSYHAHSGRHLPSALCFTSAQDGDNDSAADTKFPVDKPHVSECTLR